MGSRTISPGREQAKWIIGLFLTACHRKIEIMSDEAIDELDKRKNKKLGITIDVNGYDYMYK